MPGASIAVQTYGDFLNFNPHLHAIVTDGCFFPDGRFQVTPGFNAEDLEEAFRYEVFKMLKKEGKINDAVIENMLSWHHSGFHVHVGNTIWPGDQDSLENLAKYIIRACFSQERMVYIPVEDTADGVAKVIYTAKDGNSHKTFDAVDWLAHLVLHIPDKYEHTVRYYGYYSNKSRGMRKKAQMDDQIPTVAPGEMSAKQFRQNWARLIQKIYEVDPLICPKCLGDMHIVAFIDQAPVIEKILRHLDLWHTHNHDPPTQPTAAAEFSYDDSFSQIPAYADAF